MMSLFVISMTAAVCFVLILVGGGLYEFLVVDPCWPKRPDLIQPDRGGISRKRFWIPAHAAFEVSLITALVTGWSFVDARFWLWLAVVAHLVMRIWSALDFIPKALTFERAEPATIEEDSARRWTRRSLLRLPLDLVTCGGTLAAFAAMVRGV
jgi:hypothetical protein